MLDKFKENGGILQEILKRLDIKNSGWCCEF